jgi:hypothetical protein
MGIAYYLRHDPNPPHDVLLKDSPVDSGTFMGVQYGRRLSARLATCERVWVIRIHDGPDGPTSGFVDMRLERSLRPYEIKRIWQPSGLTVALVERADQEWR